MFEQHYFIERLCTGFLHHPFIIESFKVKRIAKLCGYNVGTVTATSRPSAFEESMTPWMITFVSKIS